MSVALAPRRGLRRNDAAAFLGLSPSKFDEMIKAKRLPAGFMVDGCRIWDLRDLDLAFDVLKAGGGIIPDATSDEPQTLAEWKARRAAKP